MIHRDHDQKRTAALYPFLVGTLARSSKEGRKLLEKKFGSRSRTFLEKLRRATGPISTGEIVERLSILKRYFQSSGTRKKLTGLPHETILTSKEIYKALLKLIELTPRERQDLGLDYGDSEIIMRQSLLNIWSGLNRDKYDSILRLYEASLEQQDHHIKVEKDDFSNIKITEKIRQIIYIHLGSEDPEQSTERKHAETIIEKHSLDELVISEVNQIILKSGVEQLQLSDSFYGKSYGRNKYAERYLPMSFISRLTAAVVDNKLLTYEFPVFIDSISIEESGPLPLSVSVISDYGTHDKIQNASFNGNLLDLDESLSNSSELDKLSSVNSDFYLARQHVYRIRVRFYVLAKRDQISTDFPETYTQLCGGKAEDGDSDDHEKICFSLESAGVGGVLSHATKLINNAVLSDLYIRPSSNRGPGRVAGFDVNLRADYFPIAHDVLLGQEFPHSNVSSPIWAHSLVMLCRNDALGEAMDASRRNGSLHQYKNFSFADPIESGDYCGFDLLLCEAKAALHSRLQAIRHTGIHPSTYVQALYSRIERKYLLEKAMALVSSYPYSSFAQEGLLQDTILKNSDGTLSEEDSYTVFAACLTIAETFLTEGLYRKAWTYLSKVIDVLARDTKWYDKFGDRQANLPKFKIFSGTLIVRFCICLGYYFAMVDEEQEAALIGAQGFSPFLPQRIAWEDSEETSWSHNPQQLKSALIRRAWEALDASQKHLSVRMAKYFIINEESQGAFYPHYKFLSEIYFLRAQIFLFFPGQIPTNPFYKVPTDISDNPGDRIRTLDGRKSIASSILFLLEKARLYGASSGNMDKYVHYTAYQSWAYSIACLSRKGASLRRRESQREASLRRREVNPGARDINCDDCLKWARRLRNDALISYEKTGKNCYFRIKEKSGLSTTLTQKRMQQTSKHGPYYIEAIPTFREIYGEGGSKIRVFSQGDENEKSLDLDMSLLAIKKSDLEAQGDTDGVIYLFGPSAAHLFFARAMYHLASPFVHEFPSDSTDPSVSKTCDTIQEWETKFKLAYRLFIYAFSIADDGGEIKEVSSEPNQALFEIGRSFSSPNPDLFPEAAALRDLYPLRTSEIADLGRVFAAACALMLLRLQDSPNLRRDREAEIRSLLDDLHASSHCQRLDQFVKNSDGVGLLCGQNRYNGHLSSHLGACKGSIIRLLDEYKKLGGCVKLSDFCFFKESVFDRLIEDLYYS